VLALDDGAIALLISTAARLPREADRVAFLKRFAAAADPSPAPTETNVSVRERPDTEVK
jgi:hypothetical protein